jgi:glycosyltransferase involved in cell wall biosynthesis
LSRHFSRKQCNRKTALIVSSSPTRDRLTEYGALAPEDNKADFARYIVTLMNDPALRTRLGAEGGAYASEWNADALAKRLANAYQEVIRSNSCVSPERVAQAGNASPAKVAIW